MSEGIHVIRFGVYGKTAFGIMRHAFGEFSRYRRIVWWFERKFLKTASDGEVVYDTTDDACPKNFTESNIKMYKRGMANALLRFARDLIVRRMSWREAKLFQSPAQIRGKADADKPLGLEQCQEATLKHIILLYELLHGDKPMKNVLSKYTAEEAEAVISHPADPFTASAVQVLLDRMKELKAGKVAELNLFFAEKRAQEEKIHKRWDGQISELEKQVAAMQAVAE